MQAQAGHHYHFRFFHLFESFQALTSKSYFEEIKNARYFQLRFNFQKIYYYSALTTESVNLNLNFLFK
jgi:hypothetical protein